MATTAIPLKRQNFASFGTKRRLDYFVLAPLPNLGIESARVTLQKHQTLKPRKHQKDASPTQSRHERFLHHFHRPVNGSLVVGQRKKTGFVGGGG